MYSPTTCSVWVYCKYVRSAAGPFFASLIVAVPKYLRGRARQPHRHATLPERNGALYSSYSRSARSSLLMSAFCQFVPRSPFRHFVSSFDVLCRVQKVADCDCSGSGQGWTNIETTLVFLKDYIRVACRA